MLELAIQDIPLAAPLELLVRTVEECSTTGMLASILVLDETGKRLCHGAAPSLPSAYNAAIDGIEIGDGVGSCGTSAFRKVPGPGERHRDRSDLEGLSRAGFDVWPQILLVDPGRLGRRQ